MPSSRVFAGAAGAGSRRQAGSAAAGRDTCRLSAALDAIAALKRELSRPPAALPACRNDPAPGAPATTRLDGTWQMDTGRSASAPEYLDENWGHWILVFDRGRFAITQQNTTSCTWGYGTYSVDGDETTWQFTDGGGGQRRLNFARPGGPSRRHGFALKLVGEFAPGTAQ